MRTVRPWHYTFIPGRLRVNAASLRRNTHISRQAQKYLGDLDGVRQVTVNLKTGQILILYDPHGISIEDLIEHLLSIRRKITRGLPIIDDRDAVEPEDVSLDRQLAMLTFTGGGIAALTGWRLMAQKTAIASSPLVTISYSLLAIVTAYPFLNSGLTGFLKKMRVNHDLLLGVAGAGLAILRGNLLGLGVYWLTSLSVYLQSKTIKQSEERLSQLIRSLAHQSSYSHRQPIILEHEGALLEDSENIMQRSGMLTRHRKSVRVYSNRLTWVALAASLWSFVFHRSFDRTLSVLLAATPAAASLSVAAAYRAGLSGAAGNNIIIRDIQALELLTDLDGMVIGKNGVLTHAVPQVKSVVVLDTGYDGRDLISYAAVNPDSSYLSFRAVCDYAGKQDISPRFPPGLKAGDWGVAYQAGEQTVLVGNESYMNEHHIDLSPAIYKIRRLRRQQQGVLFVAVENKLAGLIGLQDEINPHAGEMLANIRAHGVEDIYLMTADSQERTVQLAQHLGIEHYYHNVSPRQKLKLIQEIKDNGHIVAMVGEGDDDVPALRNSDVSMVLGSTQSIAALRASTAVLGEGLNNAGDILQIARITSQVARQNFILAAGFNLSGLALALSGRTGPWEAILLESAGKLSVLLNSYRLYRLNPPDHFALPVADVQSTD